jgi:myo-inositol-1(or 4)-monophosphatase
MNKELHHFTTVAVQAALRAGEELKKGFCSPLSYTEKPGIHNFVTEYDKKSEEIITSMIEKAFPDHSILAEEGGETKKSSLITWIIDPLDGTSNFAHQIPAFCISIAAALEKDVLCGVVYQPITHELFIGQRGHGSTLNGRPLKVSHTRQLEKAFLATGFPYNLKEDPKGCIEHLASILHLGLPIRRLGSAALDLCYTAAGRFDAYWEVSLQPWDLAAGRVIVEEALGSVTSYDNQPIDIFNVGSVLATNGHLHPLIMPLLKA